MIDQKREESMQLMYDKLERAKAKRQKLTAQNRHKNILFLKR
jgi:hypothetical protein